MQIVVVDVSGKGEEAGTRALLLSGAFGGLLGALPPDRLPAGRQRLPAAPGLGRGLRHRDPPVASTWPPGTSRCAAPATHRPPTGSSGTGRWSVLRTDGPVLGLIAAGELHLRRRTPGRGDAVLLYTDGMVEEPRRDIDLGIDRMLGEAESLLRGSFEGAAERLATSLGSRDDDRAMMVVHRA